jgi:DNA-binding HxlR family transcriptional regulator
MKETKMIRKKWLTIRLNEEEEKKLLEFFQKSTAQGLSEYARGVLLKRR